MPGWRLGASQDSWTRRDPMTDMTSPAAFHDAPNALPEATKKGLSHLTRNHLKKAAMGLAVVAGVAGAADYGRYYWTTGQYLVSTDDAYVKTDFTTIAPKVSGYIAEV